MDRKWLFIIIPVLFLVEMYIITLAFQFISAPSDFLLLLGVVFLGGDAIGLVLLFKLIKKHIK